MPIYEYQCADCHHQFDVLQKLNDEHIKTCPACSKESAVRLVSAAAFQLKGTGWYATDFKNKGAPEKKSEHATSKKSEQSAAVPETKGAEKKVPEATTASNASNSASNNKGERD